MERQIAFSFDKVTVIKILKGIGIAAFGGATIAALDFIGTIEISDPILAALVATLVPALVNAVKEWIKGDLF